MSTLPLSKIRVLDLTRVLAGPLATQTLADLGADVIKIERPVVGDDSRTFGAPFLPGREGLPAQDTGFYLSANRNKKSVALNIATPRGQEIIREMVKQCDVLMENYKVGDLARYGLDYDSIRAINPKIIYCSLTGFGQNGPYNKRPGYDGIFQGMSGLMSVTGHPDGAPGAGPMKVGPSIADVISGLNTVNAVMAALYHRDANGGKGQYIDISLLDCTVTALSHYAQMFLISGVQPPRRGTGGNGGIPAQAFNCSDRAIMITAGNNMQFRRLCDVIGKPEWADDPRFSTNDGRLEHRFLICDMIDEVFRTRPSDHWLPLLDKADVPAGPINDLTQVFADPQIKARNLQVTVKHPLREDLPILASPLKFSETPIEDYRAPPMLGQNTAEVLKELLGMDDKALATLRAEKII